MPNPRTPRGWEETYFVSSLNNNALRSTTTYPFVLNGRRITKSEKRMFSKVNFRVYDKPNRNLWRHTPFINAEYQQLREMEVSTISPKFRFMCFYGSHCSQVPISEIDLA